MNGLIVPTDGEPAMQDFGAIEHAICSVVYLHVIWCGFTNHSSSSNPDSQVRCLLFSACWFIIMRSPCTKAMVIYWVEIKYLPAPTGEQAIKKWEGFLKILIFISIDCASLRSGLERLFGMYLPALLWASWSNVLSASTGLGSDFLSHHFVYEVEKAHDQV